MLSVTAERTLADSTIDESNLLMEVEILDDGLIAVSLLLDSSVGICGLLATIEYDSDALVFVSCGAGNDDALELSYRSETGRIRFLLDGAKNCAPQGALATFYFRIAGESGGGYVRILPIEQGNAFCIDAAGNLQDACMNVPHDAIIDVSAPEREQPSGVHLSSVSLNKPNFGLVLSLVGDVTGQRQFAAGFNVFVVDVESADTVRLIAARITDGDRVELEVEIPIKSRLCVIITPLLYNGKEIITGEKQVIFTRG